MANRTIGILGLGIFGQSVLKTLQDQDVDIIAIDDHEDVINQYEPMITTGIVGDITELDLLDAADIGNCDTVVIATGENLESSVLAVMHCKALGVEHVIAKVKNEVTKEILEKIGADLVILPEVEAGMSLAKMVLFQHRIEVFSWMKRWWWSSLRFHLLGRKKSSGLGCQRGVPSQHYWLSRCGRSTASYSDCSRLYLARRGARDGGDRQPVSG